MSRWYCCVNNIYYNCMGNSVKTRSHYNIIIITFNNDIIIIVSYFILRKLARLTVRLQQTNVMQILVTVYPSSSSYIILYMYMYTTINTVYACWTYVYYKYLKYYIIIHRGHDIFMSKYTYILYRYEKKLLGMISIKRTA